MPRRRPPTLRVVGYDRLPEDHEVARKIVRVFSCHRAYELPEGLDCWAAVPCAHSDSCMEMVQRIRRIITADRIEERRATGEILVKLTTMIRDLKKEAAPCRSLDM